VGEAAGERANAFHALGAEKLFVRASCAR
jgi:hypothetical protein